ncbi:MAG: histidine triad nucleotide-binding protein [Chloroflexi bacterium]|nr:histidine triad nucleotide-binding protein [Chloroflexota bacterium]
MTGRLPTDDAAGEERKLVDTAATCLFCRIAAGALPARVAYQDEDVIAFEDIHPVAPTHLLVVPRQHIPSLADVQPADGPLLGKLLLVANSIARQRGIAERGYRVLVNVGRWGGQTVDHLHLHVVGGRPLERTVG